MSSPLRVCYYVAKKLYLLANGDFAGSVILDCGCGFGRNGHVFRSFVDEGSFTAYLVGCDIFKKYLIEVKRFNPYDELVLCDIRFPPFRFGVIDHIIASEVIEHVDKEDGKRMLQIMEQLSVRNVIVTTPLIPRIQEEIRGNPYERHRSIWKHTEFEAFGFETETRGYEESLVWAIRKLHLDRLAGKIIKSLWKHSACFLIASKKRQNSLDAAGVNVQT